MKKRQIAITLGIMCFILTIAISIQLKTIQNSNNTISQSLQDDRLRDEVLRWKEKYDNAYQELTESEKRLTIARQEATQNDTTDNAKQEQIRQNNMLLGTVEVQGQGLQITLADNNKANKEGLSAIDPSLVLVQQQLLVKEML